MCSSYLRLTQMPINYQLFKKKVLFLQLIFVSNHLLNQDTMRITAQEATDPSSGEHYIENGWGTMNCGTNAWLIGRKEARLDIPKHVWNEGTAKIIQLISAHNRL